MNFSHFANKLRDKISNFSGILSQGLDKTVSRFINEAIYGILASESVLLTEIGRKLESSISLKKIEERFSRQLIKDRLWECIHKHILALASNRIKEKTLLILDLSDVKKKYAENMEYMATVRDGSDHGELVNGYWTNQIIAAEIDSNEITPLHFSLYSQASPDFSSENDQIKGAINQVGEAVDNKGIWVIDRGGDRSILYDSLLKERRDFIIRMVGARNVIHSNTIVRSLWLAFACKLPYKKSIVRLIKGKEASFDLRFGFLPIQLPNQDKALNMIVVKGFGSKPMMLLTTLPIQSAEKDLWFIIQAYMKRWCIEETIRFIKQTYDLENIRLLKYKRLQNMMALLLAVFYFISVILDQSQKLNIMAGYILKSAKRVFGIPDFKYYALGDGICNIFSRHPGKLKNSNKIRDSQLVIGFE